uniref:Uncharacterized protein n=1 Tax=Salix viminalis TaxID=40686 RepID=A0A6N2KRP6_SALVM
MSFTNFGHKLPIKALILGSRSSSIYGRITEVEVKEIIMLSASANKLSRLQQQSEEYAALIMEELDPERFGYIEKHFFYRKTRI